MGAVKALWMAEYEQIGDEYAAGKIDKYEFRTRMKKLGFDPLEIEEHQELLDRDREETDG